MKVLLVGDYPPPYGGVSVQIWVLRRRLAALPGVQCRVLDIGASRRERRSDCLPARNPADFVGKLFVHAARQYVIHLHTNGHNVKSWLVSLTCAMAGMLNARKTVVSVGSGSFPDFVRGAGRATRALIRMTLKAMGAVVCRNEPARAAMIDLGIPAAKILVLPGFYGVRAGDTGEVPAEIGTFLAHHSPVLAAMGSSGREYGIPLVVEAATRLRSRHPRLGLLLIGAPELDAHALDGSLLVTGGLPHDVALGVVRKATVFVRPTYFDGDASSVREALALGVPVVASDTDFRPEGVTLFRRGDAADLTEKITHALDRGLDPSVRAEAIEESSPEQLLDLYGRVAGEPRFTRRLA
jgi:glycosyltransferase involved in cell wall biosynthesis